MPLLTNAIPGVASFEREKKKAHRMSQDDFKTAPDWAKNWTPDEMKAYVLTNWDDPIKQKVIAANLAWMCGALRDYMLLKQEV